MVVAVVQSLAPNNLQQSRFASRGRYVHEVKKQLIRQGYLLYSGARGLLKCGLLSMNPLRHRLICGSVVHCRGTPFSLELFRRFHQSERQIQTADVRAFAVQGDVEEEIAELIVSTFAVPRECIHLLAAK